MISISDFGYCRRIVGLLDRDVVELVSESTDSRPWTRSHVVGSRPSRIHIKPRSTARNALLKHIIVFQYISSIDLIESTAITTTTR